MKVFIITGTSRGLGQAIAEQLMAPDHLLLCISRNRNEDQLAQSDNVRHIPFDLNETDRIESLMQTVFDCLDQSKLEGIYLINNAGVVAPLSNVESGDPVAIAANIHINLLAPVLLASLFIRHTKEMQIDKRIINISSGSAQNLLPGMSVYSASKAGLDVFTRSVGIEQGEGPGAVKIASVWPGMVDTALQQEARTRDSGQFAAAELFHKAKESGMLTSPERMAGKVIQLLFGEMEQGSVVDLFG
ncbi:SDR family NAD(P)-dependent oxidoreductase [Paenibacillus sp. GYB004]|uniref:SDR family NAD(P)-dependent oxidoreductase n=1 Tax=Paenibacillus sp. GYB004 TaxID=2994393 RepID=UPI002F969679